MSVCRLFTASRLRPRSRLLAHILAYALAESPAASYANADAARLPQACVYASNNKADYSTTSTFAMMASRLCSAATHTTIFAAITTVVEPPPPPLLMAQLLLLLALRGASNLCKEREQAASYVDTCLRLSFWFKLEVHMLGHAS